MGLGRLERCHFEWIPPVSPVATPAGKAFEHDEWTPYAPENCVARSMNARK